MKRLYKYAFSLLLLVSNLKILAQHCNTPCTEPINNNICLPIGNTNANTLSPESEVYTYINYRSQGANTARQLIGWQTEIYRPCGTGFYAVGTFAFEYQRTFNSKNIARNLFGTDKLIFQGSDILDRNNNSLVADYFGLGEDFNSSIIFNPQIENYIFDWNIFIGLNRFYFRAHFPLVHSKWSLFKDGTDCFANLCTTPAPTNSTLPACFVNSNSSIATIPGLRQAFICGDQVDIFGSSNSGCIYPGTMKETQLADVDLIFGYLLIDNCFSHLGLYLQYVAPTGTNYTVNSYNNLCGTYFKPQIGNGHHNEIGGGITGHTMLFDDSISRSLAFYFEGNITHLFSNTQCRLFDLCNGSYTRYMLLREFDTDGVPTGNIIRANNTNLLNRLVDVKINTKVDFSFLLAYRYCNWGLDMGYNIYYHSQEELNYNKLNLTDSNANLTQYGIAGLTGSCCFSYDVINPGDIGCVIDSSSISTTPISNTLTTANMFDPTTSIIPASDVTIDSDTESICLAFNSEQPTGLEPCSLLTAANGYRPIPPVPANQILLNNSNIINNINLNSGLSPAYLTHKIFFNITYMWLNMCGADPFIGFGGEVEFDGINHDTCFSYCPSNKSRSDKSRNKDNCCKNKRVGLDQWGIWIKFGLSL